MRKKRCQSSGREISCFRDLVSAPWKYVFALAATLIGLHSLACSQQPADYDIQANIIYRFSKYIDWPESKSSGDFVIGVVGESPLTSALSRFTAGKTAFNRKIIIRQYASSAATFDCHILFISDEESGSMKKIVAKTGGASVLIVTEADGMAQKGACINFIVVEEHLKLEINKTNIEKRNLSIATELLQLGKTVK